MHFFQDVHFEEVYIISNKFNRVDTKEMILKLQELIKLHKRSMNKNLNAALEAKNPIYRNFYEQTAYGKMDLINQLCWKIESLSHVRLCMPIELRIRSWNFIFKEDKQNQLKSYLDIHEEALYFCYNLLAEDLLFSVSKMLNQHVGQLESTLIMYGYLKRHV